MILTIITNDESSFHMSDVFVAARRWTEIDEAVEVCTVVHSFIHSTLWMIALWTITEAYSFGADV